MISYYEGPPGDYVIVLTLPSNFAHVYPAMFTSYALPARFMHMVHRGTLDWSKVPSVASFSYAFLSRRGAWLGGVSVIHESCLSVQSYGRIFLSRKEPDLRLHRSESGFSKYFSCLAGFSGTVRPRMAILCISLFDFL